MLINAPILLTIPEFSSLVRSLVQDTHILESLLDTHILGTFRPFLQDDSS